MSPPVYVIILDVKLLFQDLGNWHGYTRTIEFTELWNTKKGGSEKGTPLKSGDFG